MVCARIAEAFATTSRSPSKDKPARSGERASLLYIASSGGAWRLLPTEFPPFFTVQKYFYRWQDDGMPRTINNALVMIAREQADKQPSPTAGIIDSQSVKTTESGGIRGFDAGKKINGRKRHIVVDTLGLMVS